ncbi:MAG TPA: hypothetical protein VNM48_02850 [Chloroflexota bacterium]|nr:hypothetical protein [Chloroflexota bacterium]
MAHREQLDSFRLGLYPILIAGDVDAFQSYLGQWEDLLGDTAELMETSEAQQRRTMDALLRRPQQFNLPPWPRQAPVAPRLAPAPDAAQVAAPVPAAAAEPVSHTVDEPEGTSGAYQLDMLSGELVPISRRMHPSRLGVPPEQPVALPARKRRSRLRRLPPNLAQLVLWSDGELTV